MRHQQGLLIGRLDRHEPHRWACHGLADGGCVGSIAFRPFDIALHIARRHQTHGVTELGDFPRPIMSGSAGFHADQARRILAKKLNDLLPPQLTADDDFARAIHAMHLEYVFGEINADGANLHVDDPPPVIRCSTITLLAHSMPGAGVVHYIKFDCEAPYLWDGSLPLDSFRAVRVPAREAVGQDRTFLIHRTTRSNQIGSRTGPPRSIARL